MNKILNIGVIGCGYWGPNLARNFANLPDCSLKYLCDLDEKRLKHVGSLYRNAKTTRRMEDLIEDPDLDAVVIATSVRFHHPMAKAALQAGKHVLVEKPLAGSSAQCVELLAIAKAMGLIVMVGHTFLYSPAVRKIKEIVDRGDIGEIRYINARRLNLGLFQKDINVTWDLAPHDISIVSYVMDENPLSLTCRGACNITQGIEDVTTMCLTFRRQRSAIIQSSWLDPRKTREMTIVGSKRMIVYDDLAPQEKIKLFDARVDRPPHNDTFAEFQYAYHYGDIFSPFIKQEEPLKTECQHFLDCIRNGVSPITDGRCGLEVVRVLEAASASLKRDGAPVALVDGAGQSINDFSAAG